MQKKSFFILIVLFNVCLNSSRINAQSNSVHQTNNKVLSLKQSSNRLFEIYSEGYNIDVSKDIKDAVFLKLNTIELQNIRQEAPSQLFLSIPLTNNTELQFELRQEKILTDNFSVVTDKKENIYYTPGLYFQGKIASSTSSLAGFALFENSIISVFSFEHNNYVLGEWKNEANPDHTIYILYKSNDVLFDRHFKCSTPDNNSAKSLSNTGEQVQSNQCIKVYFECDYQMYLDNGNSVSNVTNFVTGLFNVVQLLYTNEQLNIELSQIYVWTNSDPYIPYTTSNDLLNNFQSTRTTFNGDVAHLLTTRPLSAGGLAYLDILCDLSNAYAISNIDNSYQSYPTYDWTINVVTHELGHNFGSHHTHWCGWPGGPIDDCVAVDDGPCAAGPHPVQGTIMSYCHLSIGVDFTLGFGPLPGGAIRTAYNGASCLTACASPPQAQFTTSTTEYCSAPATVNFTDQTIGYTTSWAWDVDGNGTIDYTTQSPTHTYNATGSYTVTLITTNANGSDTIVKPNYIIVGTVTPAVSIAITTGSNTICANLPVEFTATPVNGGPTPTYQWYNGSNPIAGAVYPTYTSSLLSDNDVISCQIVSNATCPSPSGASSNSVTMHISPNVVPSISIAASGATSICAGETVSFTATATNGGTNPTYQWKVNGNNVGTNNSTYSSSSFASGDLVTCTLTSTANCANPTNNTSNLIAVVVNPIVTPTVNISITTGTNPTCPNGQLIFTATSTNGGVTPVYQWQVNGNNSGIGNTYSPLAPSNGEIITCILTSNAACVSSTTATSSGTTLTVLPSQVPTVSIAISSGTNPTCSGSSPTFSATAGNATSPTYQWFVNGASVTGATNSTFTPGTITNGSTFTCLVSSAGACPESTVSSGITLEVAPIATVNFISDIDICGGPTPTTIFSSNPLGADFSWTNSNTSIGLGASGNGNIPSFNAINSGSAPIVSTVTVTPTISGCAGNTATYTITVEPTATITQNGNVLTSSSASSYQWYRNGQLLPNATNQSYTAQLFGYYSVITDGGVCQSNIIGIGTDGIDELENAYDLLLYPNPNDGNFFIYFNLVSRGDYQLKLFNSLGQIVFDETLKNFQGEYSRKMALEFLNKGVYLLTLTGESGEAVKRMIIY